MSRLMVISFDAVSDSEWMVMSERYTNISAFTRDAAVSLGMRSVFPSNTYPAHCSVVTGKHPNEHGVISNTEPFPSRHPRWVMDASSIRTKTLWQAAHEAGLTTAAILWPCTGKSKYIRWNIPEIHTLPGESQVAANLRSGSKLLQLEMMLRYGKLLDGINQPALDNFVTACAVDILRRKRPDLTLVHLTCYDALCHMHGRNPEKLKPAYASLNDNLGRLLEAAGSETTVVVFSDHAQLNVHTVLTPNDILIGMGLINTGADGYAPGARNCFIECCGGSAFFHPGTLPESDIERVRAAVSSSEGFSRFAADDEMLASGRVGLPFGFCAKQGWCYNNVMADEKGNHGYPLDMLGYETFCAVRGKGFTPGETRYGGDLRDIAPLAAGVLNITL